MWIRLNGFTTFALDSLIPFTRPCMWGGLKSTIEIYNWDLTSIVERPKQYVRQSFQPVGGLFD